MARTASVRRETRETKIALDLNLDGTGACSIASGVGFLDHMLTLLAKHGRFDLQIPTQKVGSFDTELVQEFWFAFARSAGCTLHFRQMAGSNSHHIIEAAFKAAGRSLKEAVSIDPSLAGEIPSSKGTL